MTVAINTPAVVKYEGNDAADTFSVVFPTYEAENVHAVISDSENIETALVLDTDFTLSNIGRPNTLATFVLKDAADVPPGWMGPIPDSQAWLIAGKLKTGYKLFIKFSDEANQPTTLRNFGSLTPTAIEKMTDRLTMNIRALRYEIDKALKFSDASYDEPGIPVNAEELVERLTLMETTLAEFLDAGGSLPGGVIDGGFLEGDTTVVGDAVWKDGAYVGYSARFGAAFASTGLDDTILKILDFAYLPPQISLGVSPSSAVREKGSTVASVSMSASTTKRSDLITAVTHFRNGVLVHTEAVPNANGGVEVYVDSTPFSDTMSFYSKVYDGTTLIQSNTVTYSYAYPYYEGKGAAGLNSSGIVSNLNKVVRGSTANVAVTTSPTSEHFYFCYPAAYAALTSILDPNGFETISGYTARTVSITGLDGTPQSYRVYELTLPTTQVAFTNTFKR